MWLDDELKIKKIFHVIRTQKNEIENANVCRIQQNQNQSGRRSKNKTNEKISCRRSYLIQKDDNEIDKCIFYLRKL